jgi:2-polyprenyl-6-methoxyphenol hydroxylase-like FAD-dependent oxidoreductase
VSDSLISVFDELVGARPPVDAPVLFETACVLGGSVAGLLAARVLSDHARRVVIVERDEVSTRAQHRLSTPQDQQVHTLLPAGRLWIERWLPGFTQDALDNGAVLSGPGTSLTAFDGRPQVDSDADFHLLAASRPFLETRIRAHILALPNVSILRGRATGLRYRDAAVSAVTYMNSNGEGAVETDFVVDAMGRSSRLSDWVGEHGYDRPRFERLKAPINYATAIFERTVKAEALETATALGIFSPQHTIDGVSVAAANAVEDRQWIVMLMGYGDARPGRTIEEFRKICTRLPAVFGHATSGPVSREIVTYHQEESRRRDFAQLERFPAGLVGVGDVVASFNPIYGQGMSSAALHASCLSSYLTGGPDLTAAAGGFFRLQQVVVDAAWAISAGGDSARLDAVNGAVVPEEVRQQRWAVRQITEASLVDPAVARAFNEVSFMLRHPASLADPALMRRAIAANAGTPG